MLHALSTRRAASFEAANSLNRLRNDLSDSGPGLPGPDVRQPRPRHAGRRAARHPRPAGKTEATAPGRPPRLYWERAGRSAVRPGRAAETTALVDPGLCPGPARRPASSTAPSTGSSPTASATAGSPHKAKGPALAALASYYGRARGAEDRYRLTVTVNDTQVAALDVAGPAEGKAIAVPRTALKVGAAQPRPVRDGGPGPFGYAVTLPASPATSAPTRTARTASASIDRRVYLPGRPRARRQDPAGRLRRRGQPDDVREPGHPGRARRPGPGRRSTACRNVPLEHARVGARLPGRRGAPARRHDPDRGLGADPGHVLSSWPTAC